MSSSDKPVQPRPPEGAGAAVTLDRRVAELPPTDRDFYESACERLEAVVAGLPAATVAQANQALSRVLDSFDCSTELKGLLAVAAARMWVERWARTGEADPVRMACEAVPSAQSAGAWVQADLAAWWVEIRLSLPPSNAAPPASREAAASEAALDQFVLPAHLTLVRECQRSGMGRAMVVHNARMNRIEVLKAASDSILGNPVALERFVNEPQKASRINHPNIVTVHGADESHGRPYFLMEFMNAGSLADRLQGGPLPPRQAVQYMLVILRALQVVHVQGQFAHGDIKPQNILFTRTDDDDEHIKLSDFGLTRPLPRDWKRAVPADLQGRGQSLPTSMLMGTPGFIPPEMLDTSLASGQADPSLDGRGADLFAVGVTLYACLTGRLPYQASATSVDLFGPLVNPLLAPSTYSDAVESDLDAICLRALAQAPASRYQDAREFADALESWLDHAKSREPLERVGETDEPAELRIALTTGAASTRSRRNWKVLALAGAALIGVCALGMYSAGWFGTSGYSVGIDDPELAGLLQRLPTVASATRDWSVSPRSAFVKRIGERVEQQLNGLDPAARARAIRRLESLGERSVRSSAVAEVVTREPALALGLAATHDPSAFANELNRLSRSSPEGYRVLVNLLVLYPDREISTRVLDAWRRHGESITMLWRSDLPGCETLFFRDWGEQGAGNTTAAEVYDDWLDRLFPKADPLSSKDASDRITLLIDQGDYIRARLARDSAFQRSFVDVLWPRLLKLTDDGRHTMDTCLRNQLIWSYLARDDGERLAAQFGMLPAQLLVDPDSGAGGGPFPYPPQAQPTVIRILEGRRDRAMQALFDPELAGNDRFRRLLAENVATDRRALSICVAQVAALKPGNQRDTLLDELLQGGPAAVESRPYPPGDLDASWSDDLPGELRLAAMAVQGRRIESEDAWVAAIDGAVHLAQLLPAVLGGGTSGASPTFTAQATDAGVDAGRTFANAYILNIKQSRMNTQRLQDKISSIEKMSDLERTFCDVALAMPARTFQTFLDLDPSIRREQGRKVAQFFMGRSPVAQSHGARLLDASASLTLDTQGRLKATLRAPKDGGQNAAPKAGNPADAMAADWWLHWLAEP
ncbi:MAG: serine/threonine-protein kinase [Tepidisphaeraceae bacterium]